SFSIRFQPMSVGKSAGANCRGGSRCKKPLSFAQKQALLRIERERNCSCPRAGTRGEKKKSKQVAPILVLEADEQLGAAILNVLDEAAPGVLVEMTRSLEEAQKIVLGVKPELFVLDVDQVPDLGQDFVYDLRTSHQNARAIILTGVHLPEQREHMAGLGAIHFLEKPVAHWDFVELARGLMQPAPDQAAE